MEKITLRKFVHKGKHFLPQLVLTLLFFVGMVGSVVGQCIDFTTTSGINTTLTSCTLDTDGADIYNISSSFNGYTGFTGNYFVVEDQDDTGVCSSSSTTLYLNAIDASSFTNSICFSGLFASDNGDSGTNIDSSDDVFIDYSSDGSNWTTGLELTGTIGSTNNDLWALDSNGEYCTLLSSSATELTFDLPYTSPYPSTIYFRVRIVNFNRGGQDVAFDNLCVQPKCGLTVGDATSVCNSDGTYNITIPYTGVDATSSPSAVIASYSGSGMVTFDPTVADGTIVIASIPSGEDWTIDIIGGEGDCNYTKSGASMRCETCPATPTVPSGVITISACLTETSVDAQDIAADADATLATPYGTWAAAVARAVNDNSLIINIEEGVYTDNGSAAGFSAIIPASLAGLSVYGNGAVFKQVNSALQEGFVQVQADNVTFWDLSFTNFDDTRGGVAEMIDVENIIWNNCHFDASNRASDAVIISHSADVELASVTFNCCTFNNNCSDSDCTNPAPGVPSSQASAMEISGNSNVSVDFINTTWNCNHRIRSGGALRITRRDLTSPGGPTVYMQGGGFYNNKTYSANAVPGGAVHVYDGSLTIDGTEFINNNSNSTTNGDSGGGAIAMLDGILNISNAYFASNSTGAGGGAIWTGTLVNSNISNTQFLANNARTGGAFFISIEDIVLIANSTFDSNTATEGTAIYVEAGAGTREQTVVTLSGSIVSNNSGGGSAFYVKDAITSLYASIGSGMEDIITITNSILCKNTSDYSIQENDPTETGCESTYFNGSNIIGVGGSVDNFVIDYSTGTCPTITPLTPLVAEACPPAPTATGSCGASIKGIAFFDDEPDGLIAGDAGINGVTVKLFDCGINTICGDGDDMQIGSDETTATASDGITDGTYCFTNVPDGTYYVQFTTPSGNNITQQLDTDPTDTDDSDIDDTTVTATTSNTPSFIVNGMDVTNIDAGYIEVCSANAGTIPATPLGCQEITAMVGGTSTIDMLSYGFNNTMEYTQAYIIFDAAGVFQELITVEGDDSTSPGAVTSLNAYAAGDYTIYVINYETSTSNDNLIVTLNTIPLVTGIATGTPDANCMVLAANPMTIKICDPICGCDDNTPSGTLQTITAVPGSYNTIGYGQTYLLVNSTGLIIDIQESATFNSLDAGTYTVYAINYSTNAADNPFLTIPITANATNISALTVGSSTSPCYELAPASNTYTVTSCPVAGITETDMSGIANNDNIVCIGDGFTLTPSGGGTYSWTVPGGSSLLPDANNIITATSALAADAGVYTLTVTDTDGCISTTQITMVVNPIPMTPIVADIIVCEGESTTITIPTVTGATYTFYGPDNMTTVAQATSATNTYTPTVTAGTSATYYVTTTIGACESAQDPVMITVTEGPANDDICAVDAATMWDLTPATPLTNQNNYCATLETGEPTGGADQSVWYQYTVPAGVDAVNVATSNNDFNTIITVYTATLDCSNPPTSVNLATQLDMPFVAQNDDATGATAGESETAFCVTENTTYYIQVDGNATGEEGNFDITLTDVSGTLHCCIDCLNATCEHETIGEQDWGDGLTVTETETFDSGADTDCQNFTTTIEDMVTVCTEFTATGDETALTVAANGTGCTDANLAITYELSSILLPADLCGNANTNIDLATGEITTDLVDGQVYQYCVTVNFSADAACDIDNVCPVILNCTVSPSNDDICAVDAATMWDLTPATPLTNQNNYCATLETGEPTGGADQSVWYQYTVPAGVDAVNIATSNNDFNTIITVYTATLDCSNPPTSVNLATQLDMPFVAQNDDATGATAGESETAFCVTENTTYYIQVDGNATGEEGNFDITLTDATGTINCCDNCLDATCNNAYQVGFDEFDPTSTSTTTLQADGACNAIAPALTTAGDMTTVCTEYTPAATELTGIGASGTTACGLTAADFSTVVSTDDGTTCTNETAAGTDHGYPTYNLTSGTTYNICVTVTLPNNCTLDELCIAPYGFAEVSGTAFVDSNNDGLITGENGIQTVSVELFNSDGTSTGMTTTTDINGNYTFTNVPDGMFYVQFTTPTGYGITNQVDTDPTDADDSDIVSTTPDATTSITNPFTVSGADVPDIDAGYFNGSLSGTVFTDADFDGTDDDNLDVMGVSVTLFNAAGVQITADADGNTYGTAGVLTTDAMGNYTFENLPLGMYYVVFSNIPTNNSYTNQNTGTDDTIDSDPNTSGQTGTYTLDTTTPDVEDVDAGLINPLNISGMVFEEPDGDGDSSNDGTATSSMVTVTLYDASGTPVTMDVFGNPITPVTTTGAYNFDNIPAGMYYVTFTTPSGTNITTPGTNSSTITDLTDTNDSDINTSGQTPTFTLNNGDPDLTNLDAGFTPIVLACSDCLDATCNNAYQVNYDEFDPSTASTTTLQADGACNTITPALTTAGDQVTICTEYTSNINRSIGIGASGTTSCGLDFDDFDIELSTDGGTTCTLETSTGLDNGFPTYNVIGGTTYNICVTATLPTDCTFDELCIAPYGFGGVCMQPKMWLQGDIIQDATLSTSLIAYNSDNLMRDDLRVGNYIPLTEPYSTLYGKTFVGGYGGETINASVLSANIANPENNIVDWVIVELRSAADPKVIVASRPVLLQRDGDIVDLDGVSPIIFTSIADASYYVLVDHRNHLATMTANAIPLTEATCNVVDFRFMTDAQLWDDPAGVPFSYDGLEQASLVGVFAGQKALWMGDVDYNGQVKFDAPNDDPTSLKTEVVNYSTNLTFQSTYDFAFGYLQGDADMNGKAKFEAPNDDRTFILLQTIAYPPNTGYSTGFDFLLEQKAQ